MTLDIYFSFGTSVLRRMFVALSVCLMLTCTHINYAHSQETLNIAAVINDEVVSIYDLSQRINLVVLFSNLPNTPETHQRIAPSILRRLVIEKLHLQEAKRIGIEVPEAAIQNSISIIETSNNVPIGGMKSMLDSRGIDIETLRQQVRAELSWIDVIPVFATSKEISIEGQGLTAVEKIFNKNAVGTTPGKVLHAGSDVRVEVNLSLIHI